MADMHKDRVVASNESLWTSQMYSDMIIRCASKEYKVHRSVICPRSAFFAKACNGEFKEAKTAIIIMDNDDPRTVRRMLSYLYTLDYSDERLPDGSDTTVVTDPALPPHLRHKTRTMNGGEARSRGPSSGVKSESRYHSQRLNNVLVYAVADKYDIPELKELVKRKFQSLANNEWTNNEFEAIRDVVFGTISSQDTNFRQILSQVCIDHFGNIVNDVRLRSVVLSNEYLAYALLEHAVREKTNDMQLLDQAQAEKISMQDDLMKANLTTQRALDQNKERELMLQGELAEVKVEAQKTRDKDKQTETMLQEELAKAKAEMQRARDENTQREIVLEEELAKAKKEMQKARIQNKQTEIMLQDELAKAKAEMQRARDENKRREMVLQDELAKAKELGLKAFNQKNNLSSRLNALMDNANKWEECRNCGNDFGSWIERLGSSDDPQFQLRCSNCRCRHYL